MSIEDMKNDPYGYKKCWECGKEKTPLVWILRGILIHVCKDCRKVIEQ